MAWLLSCTIRDAARKQSKFTVKHGNCCQRMSVAAQGLLTSFSGAALIIEMKKSAMRPIDSTGKQLRSDQALQKLGWQGSTLAGLNLPNSLRY